MPGTSIEDVTIAGVLARTANPSSAPVFAPDPGTRARLAAEGRQVVDGTVAELPNAGAAAILLTGDELSHAGEEAEALLHHAARALVPEGVLALTARNRIYAEVTGAPSAYRGFSAEEVHRLLGHYGFAVELLCAPGAAGRLRAALDPDALVEDATVDVEADRDPGLLHAAPRLLALGTRSPDAATRSERFFATLHRKVVATGVLCRADDGRMLIVHDVFKQHWAIPGGVVDPNESPRDGAEREAWEETGVRVAAGPVLGIFTASWPDRVVLVYDGVPVGGGTPRPAPVHAHEVDAAEWMPVDEALRRLAPHVAFQVRRCLSEPGGTWVQGSA